MKQAIIYFIENMSKGSMPRIKEIAMYIDMDQKSIRLDSVQPSREGSSFTSCGSPRFDKLQRQLELWVSGGIESTICRRFRDLQEWDKWSKTVYFGDPEVHWKVFIQHDDGSWTLYLELGMCFPRELEEIYRTAIRARK